MYDKPNELYVVKVYIIDKNSPDRLLKVYKNGKEIEFDSIYYLDNVLICHSTNPAVAKSAIKDEKELKIKLKNQKIIKAKIEMEE